MKRCLRCGGALQAATLERLSAEEPPVKLDVHGMPAKRCPNGHAAPFDEDFMLWFIRELKERAGHLESATEKGALFMKKYLCQCGRPLGARPDRRSAVALELAYESGPPFRAELEMPFFRCEACGRELVGSSRQAQKQVALAVARLNDVAGFPHSG
jgi:hypothetical protein